LRFLVSIGSIAVCAIPSRYRQWWPIRRNEELRVAAVVSGALEFLMGVPFGLVFVNSASVLDIPSNFLMVEGAVRFLAALWSEQVLPTLPLQIVVWIQNAKESKQVDLQLGPLVADEIERGEGTPWDLRVLSCRAKPHWNPYMTIRFDGEFYQLMQEDISDGPRKFVYLLRKNPTGRLVVVVYDYDPQDVLTGQLKRPAQPS
jgi:hypothetical protein